MDIRIRQIAMQIGLFYLEKNNNNFEKTREDLMDLLISKMEIKDDKLHITLGRPGLFIGPKGKNIEELTKFLHMNVHIIEDIDCLYDWLIPREEDNFDDY